MRANSFWTIGRLALPLLLICCSQALLPAQVQRDVEELQQVRIDEQRNARLPLELSFTNDGGKPVKLGDYFNRQRPVILSLNYSSCPMLCGLQINGLIEGLEEIDLLPGEDFEVVSVSIDPLETPLRARQAKQKFLQRYDKAQSSAGWHFLVGDRPEIQRLADTVGYYYRYVPEKKEYAHAAALMICTPDGRVSRYLYGVQFDPQTVRLSLVEAGEGKIGTPLDQVLLFCFEYNADEGSYAPTAISIMRVGAVLTILVIAIVLLPGWLRRPDDEEEAVVEASSPRYRAAQRDLGKPRETTTSERN